MIGYVFESRGFSRIDIDTNESDPAYSLAFTYSVGSLEWRAQLEQERAGRRVAEEAKERMRLARIAVFSGKGRQVSVPLGARGRTDRKQHFHWTL